MITGTTKLDAVNVILATIGQAPVNTLAGVPGPDVALATLRIDEVTREIATTGYWFNEETEFPLVPDSNNFINIPPTAAVVDVDDLNRLGEVIQRGNRLYDLRDRSFEFNEEVTATIRWFFDFDELPEVARRYVMIRAARRFTDGMTPSPTLHRFTATDELEALGRLQQQDSDIRDTVSNDSGDGLVATRRQFHSQFSRTSTGFGRRIRSR